jgi:sulfur carrier protein ThiS
VKVKVKILSDGIQEQIMDVCADETYEELLHSLHINPEIVIVFRSGVPVPLDEKLTSDDVDILRVVTGGKSITINPYNDSIFMETATKGTVDINEHTNI